MPTRVIFMTMLTLWAVFGALGANPAGAGDGEVLDGLAHTSVVIDDEYCGNVRCFHT